MPRTTRSPLTVIALAAFLAVALGSASCVAMEENEPAGTADSADPAGSAESVSERVEDPAPHAADLDGAEAAATVEAGERTEAEPTAAGDAAKDPGCEAGAGDASELLACRGRYCHSGGSWCGECNGDFICDACSRGTSCMNGYCRPH